MNELLTLIPLFLRAVAGAPASASWLTPIIDDVLIFAASLIESGETGSQELASLTQQIQTMIDSGRDPTSEEFAALKARSDAAHASIEVAAKSNP